MTDRVTQHFGYGAFGVAIATPPARRRVEPRSLREGVLHWHREGAPARTARDLARGLSPPLLAALGMWMLLWVVDRPDESAIAIVPFETPPLQVARVEPPPPVPIVPEPEPLLPEPEPLRPVVRPEPEPPRPVVRPQPEPPPPVPVVRPEPPPPLPVQAPKPPPAARPRPRPAPAPAPRRPTPQIDQMIARAEVPEPVAPTRRSPQPRAPAPALTPPPVQLDRVANREPQAAPELPTRSRPAFQVARSARPAPELAPAPLPAAPDAAPAPTRNRRQAPARRERREAPAPAPLAPVAPPPPTPTRAARTPSRAHRPSGAPRPERSSAPRNVQLAATAPAPAPSTRGPAPRAARPELPPSPDRARQAEPGAEIPGISLGSLAPCVTDAREHALKQEVVAHVGNRPLCESPAGRFHFIETKNVNAFLMGIEVAPGRATTDRCGELAFALDCLDAASRRSGR